PSTIPIPANTFGTADAIGNELTYSGQVSASKVPADPTSPGYDVFGSPLTNPGTPQQNMDITGYTGDWDGVAYLVASHLTGSETVVSSTGTSTPTVSAGRIDFTIGTCPYLELSDGTVYISESDPLSLQDTIYDIGPSGNHATLTDATLPFFTTEMDGSKLLADGFSEGLPDGVELWVDPDTQTIDGSNFSTFDSETGIGRIVSDGTSVTLEVANALTVGGNYQITYEEISKTGLQLQTNFNAANTQFFESITFTDEADQTTYNMKRTGACDVTFKLSVQQIPQGKIPANPSTGLSALGQPLTSTAGQIAGQPDGVELWVDPTEETIDANNYSTYDSETGICRIVSDGTFVKLRIGGAVVSGSTYKVVATDVVATLGSLQIIIGEAVELTNDLTVDIEATGTQISINRSAACDVTFRLSVQELRANTPVYFNAPLSSSFFEADEDNLVWYDALGVPKDVTPDDLVGWGKNYSDQYFFDDDRNL
ncbi:unnamed protein product, partial [marine sediment metagenome]